VQFRDTGDNGNAARRGGGAIDPVSALAALAIAAGLRAARQRRKNSKQEPLK
jgi:hypothetical protein